MGSNKAKRQREGLAVVAAEQRRMVESGSSPTNGTEVAVNGGATPTVAPVVAEFGDAARPPDPEVSARPVRRQFTAAYKLRIVQEADRCRDSQGIGSLLRREGLYSSHLSTWRQQREAGSLSALAPGKRGRPAAKPHPDTKRVVQLEREKRHLERRLKQAEALLELQKKVSEILGIDLPPAPTDEGE